MIISHRHRYLFVELPRTGSTAIARELRQFYDGKGILFKHATYQDFLRVATPEERDYFVFSGIRNPLDDAVSLYFKYLTDHDRRFSNIHRSEKNPLVRAIKRWQFTFVQQKEPDFSSFFLRSYWLPYSNWSALSHNDFDFVIRFERLSEDFERVLERIGIEPARSLPVHNRTAKRDRDYSTYYSPAARRRARRVFGPYMERWGYDFPADWGEAEPTAWHRLQFRLVHELRMLYWRHLRFHLHARRLSARQSG